MDFSSSGNDPLSPNVSLLDDLESYFVDTLDRDRTPSPNPVLIEGEEDIVDCPCRAADPPNLPGRFPVDAPPSDILQPSGKKLRNPPRGGLSRDRIINLRLGSTPSKSDPAAFESKKTPVLRKRCPVSSVSVSNPADFSAPSAALKTHQPTKVARDLISPLSRKSSGSSAAPKVHLRHELSPLSLAPPSHSGPSETYTPCPLSPSALSAAIKTHPTDGTPSSESRRLSEESAALKTHPSCSLPPPILSSPGGLSVVSAAHKTHLSENRPHPGPLDVSATIKTHPSSGSFSHPSPTDTLAICTSSSNDDTPVETYPPALDTPSSVSATAHSASATLISRPFVRSPFSALSSTVCSSSISNSPAASTGITPPGSSATRTPVSFSPTIVVRDPTPVPAPDIRICLPKEKRKRRKTRRGGRKLHLKKLLQAYYLSEPAAVAAYTACQDSSSSSPNETPVGSSVAPSEHEPPRKLAIRSDVPYHGKVTIQVRWRLIPLTLPPTSTLAAIPFSDPRHLANRTKGVPWNPYPVSQKPIIYSTSIPLADPRYMFYHRKRTTSLSSTSKNPPPASSTCKEEGR